MGTERLVEKCPTLKELEDNVLEVIEGLTGPEECIEYCYYDEVGPSDKATEIIPGRVYYENRVDDLGVYRIYIKNNPWILIEEKPC